MKLFAPAKINLSLDLVGRRADGYHTLETVMQSISLFDTVSVERTRGDSVELTCSKADVPCGADNTVLRAADAFFKATGVSRESGLLFCIEKHIPRQAGLGGGSADAAAALRLLDAVYRTRLGERELEAIGLSAGADVPFCIKGGTALVQGIGESMKPVASIPACSVVVCKPDAGIGTKEAYAAFDRRKTKSVPHTASVLHALEAGDLPALGLALGNAFEDAGAPREIPEIEAEMLRCGAAGACMTGSGSAVFGLFGAPERATFCRKSLLKRFPAVFLCGPFSGGTN